MANASIATVTGECGADPSSGITEYQWFHALSRIEPKSLPEPEAAKTAAILVTLFLAHARIRRAARDSRSTR